MAALGLDVYGSDEEEEVSLAGPGDGAGVVLLGEYAAAAARGDADSAQPAGTTADSAAGPQAMDVDAAPGASPSAGVNGVAAPGSPGEQLGAAKEVSGLPPELARPPPGDCDPKLREKLERFLWVKHNQGREIKSELRNSRAYRNPSFLQKMVEHFSIEEFGSNILDSDSLHDEDFCDALKAALDKEQERRAAQRAATGRIDFTAGAKHTSGSQARAQPAAGGTDAAAVVQKARLAAAAAKAKASRWGHNR